MQKERGLANRGMTFEGLVKYACDQYAHTGVAMISKQNTLCIPLRNRAGKIHSAKFEEKATVDFMGWGYDVPVAFEAKHCSTDVIQISRVEPHQAAWLNKWTSRGRAVGFVLVSFQLTDIYLIPWEHWVAAQRANAAKKGLPLPPEPPHMTKSEWTPTGKASIRKDELPEDWKVKTGGGIGLDVLTKVKELWGDTFPEQLKQEARKK